MLPAPPHVREAHPSHPRLRESLVWSVYVRSYEPACRVASAGELVPSVVFRKSIGLLAYVLIVINSRAWRCRFFTPCCWIGELPAGFARLTYIAATTIIPASTATSTAATTTASTAPATASAATTTASSAPTTKSLSASAAAAKTASGPVGLGLCLIDLQSAAAQLGAI